MWNTLALLALIAGQGHDGEKLFRQMEEKVSKAQAFTLSFEAIVEAGKGGKIKGAVDSLNGNKARLEMSGEVEGKAMKMLMISNGTRMQTTGTDSGSEVQDAPKDLDKVIRVMVTRAGILLPTFLSASIEEGKQGKELSPDEKMPVSDFRLGKPEKMNGREVQVVEYKVTVKPAKIALSATVWIDPKTNLPVKRVLTGKVEDQKLTVTETYTALDLGAKFDEKRFELAK